MYRNRVQRVLHRGLPRSGKVAATLAVVAVVGAFGAGFGVAGNAAPPSCTVSTATSQPFLQWNDQSYYFLAPGGSFEQALTGWHFTGAVHAISGNESYYVNGASDTQSLWFDHNASAQSPNVCVTIHSPSVRLFAKNSGDRRSTLQVMLNYTDKSGKAKSAQVGSLTASADWAPTTSILFLDKVAPVVGGQGQTLVSFTFHVFGAGNWQIDDFYVDPIKSQ
jgi:hypothetical protein